MITKTLQKLLKAESTGGILLLIAAVAAMIIANSTLHEWYEHFIHYEISIFNMTHSVHFWVNDALMVIFFFVVGLEIKRELLVGELSSPRKAMLPVVGAVGGMIVPIIIFFILSGDKQPDSAGWGIPMATDIAFAIGILSLLGKRVPLSLKVFLTAFAIVDDMGAVIVIAIFYSSQIGWVALGIAAALLLGLFILGKIGVTNRLLFVAIAIAVWYLFLQSGVHATIAGVLLALTLPIKSQLNLRDFSTQITSELEHFSSSFKEGQRSWDHHQLESLDKLKSLASQVNNPIQWFEHNLHQITMFIIMPIFAFVNAGVYIGGIQGSLFEGITLSIILGLVVGKLIGVFSFSWLSIKLKLASLPDRSRMIDLLGIALLGGVGFTMSLFIANLSFDAGTEILDEAKIGILMASGIAAVLGIAFLSVVLPKLKK
jgi:NhaA family Na+:H+ antiporter